ncbi:hypothetical protein ACQ9BO_26545 [Flavobacterium sp. P21]|uniref:hypothetical protein n=1 Tax=Flavobacterium sp. P21 TaxID=3423948 RepID=UPI003D666B0F
MIVIAGEEIIFSYIGTKTTSAKVGKTKIINQTLEDDSNSLKEVVVTAYGIQKKQSVTGSVIQLSAAHMVVEEDNAVYNASRIDGAVPSGVQIVPGDINNPEYYFRTKKLIYVPGKKLSTA